MDQNQNPEIDELARRVVEGPPPRTSAMIRVDAATLAILGLYRRPMPTASGKPGRLQPMSAVACQLIRIADGVIKERAAAGQAVRRKAGPSNALSEDTAKG